MIPYKHFNITEFGFYYLHFDFFTQKKESCYYWDDMEGFDVNILYSDELEDFMIEFIDYR